MRFSRFFLVAIPLSCLALVSQAQSGGTKADPPNVTTKANAATGSISGKLVDPTGGALSYATVTLMKIDSTVVGGDLSKDDGSFNITGISTGLYKLRVESLGSNTLFLNVRITSDSLVKNLGNVKVGQSETLLKGVKITSEKPVMELKVDKKVFNVEKNITTAGGSATDVLQNVPSVSVDADGNVSLRGNAGVTILIDGKPATMLGTDVASALQSLPASSIESVETITNPSAKYDAQGTTGIINIILKKDNRLGINGNVSVGAGTGDKYNGNFGLNIRKGKWTVFLNSSYRLNNSYNNVTTDRTDKMADSNGVKRFYHTYEHVPRKFNGFFNTIGATYDFNKNNSLTVTQNINKMEHGFTDQSDYYIYPNTTGAGDYIYHKNRYSKMSGGPFSLSSSVDFKHKFKKKDEEISIDATFASNSIKRSTDYHTLVDTSTMAAPADYYHFPYVNEHAPGSGGNNSLNLWADYTDPLFTKNGRLGLGFKSQFYSFQSSNTPVIDSANGGTSVDYILYTKYEYTQQIHAGYINWNDQLGKFSYQVGLRAESAIYDGTDYTPSVAKLHNSFFNFFPSAFVSYMLANQQSIYLNYSRRTNRPNFFQMMPFKDLSNPGTVNMGNPSLDPEFIDNLEFSYNKQDKRGDNIILSAYYAVTHNLIDKVTRAITTNDGPDLAPFVGSILSQPINLASGTTYGLEGTGHIQITKPWDATLNVNFFQNQLVIGNSDPAYTKDLSNNSGFTWFGKFNTTVKLPKSFSLQMNANYESRKVIAQGSLKETYWVDLALRKNVMKNKATIVLNCSDIFNTHHFYTVYDLNSYYETINRVKETRVLNFTFTYRFGKMDMDKGKGKKGDMKPETKKPEVPNSEDRSKNLKEGDDGGGDQPAGGGQGQGGNKGKEGGGGH